MDRQQLPHPSRSPTAIDTKRSVADAVRQEKQKALAHGRLERAFQLRVDGNDRDARQSLAEAVRLDPALITDSTAISLAETLTNQPRDKAILQLLEDSQTAVVVSNASFVISRQGYMVLAACALLIVASLALSTVFFITIAPIANQLLTRAGIQAVNATRLDNTLRPMAAAPLWPILDTAIVLTIIILASVVASYILGHWLGGAGAVSRYLIWLICIYAVMLFVMAAALVLISKAGTPPPGSFDSIFTAGVWLFEAALPIALVINSLIASYIHDIKWIRGGAAVMVCTLVLIALFGILAGFTLIPKL